LRTWASLFRRHAKARFALAVVAPLLVLTVAVTALAFLGFRTAAADGDRVSVARQAQEVRLAYSAALDELAQSQTGVAIWSPLILELRKPVPNWTWVDDNVGTWLNFVFGHHEDIILDGDDRPVYAMVNGTRANPRIYSAVSSEIAPLVEAARGRLKIRPNSHERLPGWRISLSSTVRTSPRAIHATDMVDLNGRPAAVSVMRMIPDTPNVVSTAGHEPLLVSIRYLDENFTRDLSRIQMIAGARIATNHILHADERAIHLTSSRGEDVGLFVWTPVLPGSALWHTMLPGAAVAAGVLLTAVLLLIGGLARMMRKDARTLGLLHAAHLELTAKEAQAHHMAYHDALTGLANRALFNNAVDDAILHKSNVSSLAVFILDLDRFKQVNDTLGHLAGDDLIRQVASRLQRELGEQDLVARLGGDEFAVLLRSIAHKADAIATGMLAALREPFDVLGTAVHVGASIGIATYPTCGDDRTELMRKADIAMYQAKSEGRDTFRHFCADMDMSVRLRREIEGDLRAAMASKDGLAVYYQPQMDSAGVQVIGFEALLRWYHPTRGDLSPQLFIPIAEATGLINELGRWVLVEACGVARAWPTLSIAVNLSPVQLRTRDFAADVASIVRDAGVHPKQIELEVTEGILLDDDEIVRSGLAQLREKGFRIALDDFGTGYSSLSYLSKFEVDKIKIDKSFISRLGQSDDATAIIHAVVTLGHAMALSVTAEGVETSDQRDFLKVAGCNELQGFLFSEAIPKGDIARFIDRPQSQAAA
jgi:diguanylate cyclase (GGDEF)-like protein